MGFKSTTLPAKTLVYHGTSADEFEVLEGPSWVSRSISVADFFKKRYRGPRPRILVFQTDEPLNLLLIENPKDYAEVLVEMGYEGGDMRDIAEGFADTFGREYDGWIMPDNYPDGDDILLVDPMNALEYLGELSRGTVLE